jgi:hypothetical protein
MTERADQITEDDAERLARYLYDRYNKKITTTAHLEAYLESYIGLMNPKQKKKVLPEVIKEYKKLGKFSQESLYKKALKGEKGDLRADQRKDARNITTDEKKYVKVGAKRMDFKGLDTRPIFSGILKGKVVQCRREIVTRKGKKKQVFRGLNGQFVSRKFKKK